MSDMKREDTAPLLGSDAPAMKNLPPVSGAAALGVPVLVMVWLASRVLPVQKKA